jgi:alanine dehydrogenase
MPGTLVRQSTQAFATAVPFLVEKTVDYFQKSCGKIQNSPLAKGYSLLIGKVTPYLSINIKRSPSPINS